MAAEPEKRIEESLHAYARKRREEAGAPMEMHPATRRMLQGEVAKLKAAHPPERAWWQSFFLVWPRFAAAVGMFAVLAVGVWVFTQSEGRKASEVGQVAQRAAENQELDRGRLKDLADAGKESDRVAPSASTVEEAGKKLAEKRELRVLDESKVQLRDAEKAPAAPAATPPAPVVLSEVPREKQVAVQYDAPAQQTKESKTLLTANTDKSGDLSSSLLKQRAEGGRYFRVEDGRFVQTTDPVMKEGLGVNATAPITSGVTIAAANKPADSYSFAFQTPATNLAGSLGDARQRLNLGDTNVALGFDVATYAAAGVLSPASGPAAPVLAKSEFTRERGIQPVGGAEATLGQKFERTDGTVVPALLQKFELLQHANGRLSIRDADGAVYEGEILAAKTDSDTGAKAKAENELLRLENRRLARTDDALAATAAAPASVSFRASGTNRSKELVVINGELLREEDQLGRIAGVTGKNVADTAAAAPAPTTAPAQSEPALRAQAQSGAANTRAPARYAERVSGVNTSATVFVPTAIRGRVQIGKTNQQELRAIRSR